MKFIQVTVIRAALHSKAPHNIPTNCDSRDPSHHSQQSGKLLQDEGFFLVFSKYYLLIVLAKAMTSIGYLAGWTVFEHWQLYVTMVTVCITVHGND